MSSSIGSGGEVKTWDKQNLIRYDALVDILKQKLKIVQHTIPENTYGNLVCIGGLAEAASGIMNYLEIRAADQASREE